MVAFYGFLNFCLFEQIGSLPVLLGNLVLLILHLSFFQKLFILSFDILVLLVVDFIDLRESLSVLFCFLVHAILEIPLSDKKLLGGKTKEDK